MTQRPHPEPKIFISSIELPVNIIMVRHAVACATQVSETLSFDSKDTYHLEIAVEEAFCNAVNHFSRQPDEQQRITIEFYILEDSLIVSMRENGIPFDFKHAVKYTPNSLQEMDTVELFVHGRKGKETRLTKKLKYGVVPEGLLQATVRKRGGKRILVKHPKMRIATQDDLQEISRLAWRCYGYTQEELLYDLERLTQKHSTGELKSIVYFDPKGGNMVGHIALKYHDPALRVPEVGLAFIDPSYKCPGLSFQFGQDILKIARQTGDRGLFDCSVTSHTFSQKSVQESLGSTPCCLLMGIAASGMQANELKVTRQKKGTTISHYHPFDRSKQTIYPPSHHKEMIEAIYHWMELPRVFEECDETSIIGESSVSIMPLPDELNVCFIIVNQIGTDTIDEITKGMIRCRNERKDAVFVFLPLGDRFSPKLVEQCEKIGLSFTGIMPHIHNGDDRILLQKIFISLDVTKIRLHGKNSAKLFAYILQEQQRVCGI